MGEGLLLVGVGGVQRSLVECRLSSDLRNSSEMVSALSAQLVGVVGGWGELVLPAVGAPGNKIVAVVSDGHLDSCVDGVIGAARDWWVTTVARLFPSAIADPGFPDVTAHVTVRAAGEPTQDWWVRAAGEFAAVKRSRPVVGGAGWSGRAVCALSPRWPVVGPPATLTIQPHEKDDLSQVGWARRSWHRLHKRAGFPSTRAVAAAPFVTACAAGWDAAAITMLTTEVQRVWPAAERPVPGVPERVARIAGWLSDEAWEPGALARRCGVSPSEAERAATAALPVVKALRGDAEPGSYLALIAQDVDKLGTHIGDAEFPGGQRAIGAQLARLAASQEGTCARLHGCVVYAGGDDLLALASAAHALELARALRTDVTRVLNGPEWIYQPTASTAVVLFHASYPLSLAVQRAREALAAAKATVGGAKNGLSVVALRRGGERACSVLPWASDQVGPEWTEWEPVTDLRLLTTAPLAGALAHELERDRLVLADLAGPAGDGRVVRDELARLVGRHGGGAEHAAALYRLARQEQAGTHGLVRPVPVVLLARFLRSRSVVGAW